MHRRNVVCLTLVLLFLLPGMARAQEGQEDLAAVVAALQEKLAQQDQQIKEQERRLAQLEQAPPAATSQPATCESLTPGQRQEVQAVVAEANAAHKAPALPSWLDGLKFAGDLRLRYEYNGYDWGTNGDDKEARNRARFRARFGVMKTWLDNQLEVGMRIATGSDNDPTSTNQTFTDGFSKKDIWLDLAYAKYSPNAVKGLTVIGGKMVRPWIEDEIFFDSDVNPEGFWSEYKFARTGAFQPFVGAGYFVVNETSSGDDSTMYLAQAGTDVHLSENLLYTVAGNYQEWTDYYAAPVKARGNDSPVSRIPGLRIVNLNNSLSFPLGGRPLAMSAAFAHNCGEGDANPDYTGQDNAFAAGIKYGQNKRKGDWSLRYRYAFVEANALPGNFVDSDFGFANRRGHIIGGEYNLLDSLTLGLGVFLTEPMFSPTTNSGSIASEDMTTTVMADMVWKF